MKCTIILLDASFLGSVCDEVVRKGGFCSPCQTEGEEKEKKEKKEKKQRNPLKKGEEVGGGKNAAIECSQR